MTQSSTLGRRIAQRREEIGLTQKQLADLAGVSQPTISALEQDKSIATRSVGSIASALKVNALWLQEGLGDPQVRAAGRLLSAHLPEDLSVPRIYAIDIIDSKGSCGGAGSGQTDVTELMRRATPNVKPESFFKSRNVRAGDVLAIVADGDSMANRILHGDTVLVNVMTTDAFSSGQIYVLKTARGVAIKRVMERMDGTVVLSCDNPDKTRFPDESYTADEFKKVSILGSYLYREG